MHLVFLADVVTNLVDISRLQTLFLAVRVLKREQSQLLLVARLVADTDLIRLIWNLSWAAKQSLLIGKLSWIRQNRASFHQINPSLFDRLIF